MSDLEMGVLAYSAYTPAAANRLPTGDWTADIDLTRSDTASCGNSAIDVSSVSLRVQYYSEFNTYINQVYPAGSISPAASAALSTLLESFNDFAAFNVSYDQRRLNTTGSFLKGEVLESW